LEYRYIKLYWSIIRQIVESGCETWVFKESIIQRVSVFERKIFKKINLAQLKRVIVFGEINKQGNG